MKLLKNYTVIIMKMDFQQGYHCHCDTKSILNAIIIIITQYHLKRVVRDDPDVSDFWQRFDDTDGELDTEKEEGKLC